MKTAILEFEEYPDQSVTVRVSDIPLGEFFGVRQKLADLSWDGDEFQALSEAFQPYLIEWTFETPIEQGVFGHHIGLGVGIIREWLKAVRDVPLPLSPRSSDGTPSEDPSPES